MNKKKEHDWGFKANQGTKGSGDLLHCPLCNQWSWMGKKPFFKMTDEEYERMHQTGEIDATECLGVRDSEK